VDRQGQTHIEETKTPIIVGIGASAGAFNCGIGCRLRL